MDSTNLIPLVPVNTASTTQMLINTNMILSPSSKPSNISELSNSSMLSSGSSTLDSSTSSLALNQTPKRVRASRTSTNTSISVSMEKDKDCKYLERRKRNNVAAKKSRDARKQREDEIAIRASFLEKENSILKAQLQTLKDEAQQLRILLAQKKAASGTVGGQTSASTCANCSNCSSLAAATIAANGSKTMGYLSGSSACYDASDHSMNLLDNKQSSTHNSVNTNSTNNQNGLYNTGFIR